MHTHRRLVVLVPFWVFTLGLAGCAQGDPEHDDAVEAGESGGAGESGESGDGEAGRSAAEADGPIVMGCRKQPLVLGEVAELDVVAPQVVWTGRDFAVGWAGPDGYQIRITNGQSISNSKRLPAMPGAGTRFQPQLFWSNGRLELYYALSETVFMDAFDDALASVETRMIVAGAMFRAVQMSANEVAVMGDSALYVGGREVAKSYSYVSAVGWNGTYFSVSGVLGHGDWSLAAFGVDGSRRPDAGFSLQWCGACGSTGAAGGSFYASSPEVGRHAVAVAAVRKLTVLVEGRTQLEQALVAEQADASMLWDGARYAVLLADQAGAGSAGQRDLQLIPVTLEGRCELRAHPPLAISADAADERFPVAAAAGPGDYAIAWVRGSELVLQRCALAQR